MHGAVHGGAETGLPDDADVGCARLVEQSLATGNEKKNEHSRVQFIVCPTIRIGTPCLFTNLFLTSLPSYTIHTYSTRFLLECSALDRISQGASLVSIKKWA